MSVRARPHVGFLVDEAYLPATLTAGPMTDEGFVELCNELGSVF
jgi:hypothetical protein